MGLAFFRNIFQVILSLTWVESSFFADSVNSYQDFPFELLNLDYVRMPFLIESRKKSLTRAWQGTRISITRLTGGGGYFLPPSELRNYASDYKAQTAFDRPGEFVEGDLILFTSRSLMRSQVRSKSKCLTILSLALSRTRAYGIEISQYNDTDRVWDTSKYHPKLSVSIFKVKVIQGHKAKERSNWKFCVLAAWYTFLGELFVKIAKNDPRTLNERPKSDKFWKSGRCKNRRN